MESKAKPENADQPNIESFKWLINSIDTKDWQVSKHGELLSAIVEVLHQDAFHPLDSDVINRIAQYFALVLCHCENADIIESFNCTIRDYPTDKLEPIILQLIALMEEQFGTKKWACHEHACNMFRFVLKSHRASLHQTVIERLFSYLTKIILQCENDDITGEIFRLIIKFALSFASLLPLLIDSFESELQTKQYNWCRHENMCWLIEALFYDHRDLLQQNLIDRFFGYLKKIILQSENDEVIVKAFALLNECALSFESSLPLLIDSLESEFETEPSNWDRHQYMCSLIYSLLDDRRDTLQQNLIDRFFGYLTKVILHCENDEVILEAFLPLNECPLIFESSLPLLIDPLESELETEPSNWHRHQHMCLFIYCLLNDHRDSLQQSLVDRLFGYISKVILHCENDEIIEGIFHIIMEIFRIIIKYALSLKSSLSLLIDSLESELESKQCNWCRQKNMCWLIGALLDDHRDALQQNLIDRFFGYLTKVILHCENDDIIATAFAALHHIPLRVASSLPLLIDSFESELVTKPSNWCKHKNICVLIASLLDNHRGALQQNTVERIFAYATEQILQWESVEQTKFSLTIFLKFPLNKLESALPLLIESLESELQTEQIKKLHKHENMCFVIASLWDKHPDYSLEQNIIDRTFDYVTKLILQLESIEQGRISLSTFAQFPLSKLQSSLPLLIESLESELQTEPIKWQKHKNMSVAIGRLLGEHAHSLHQTLIDQIFNYIKEIILKCEKQDETSHTLFSSILELPSSKLESSLAQWLELVGKQVNPELIEWYNHEQMFKIVKKALDGQGNDNDTLNEALIGQIFDYVAKLLVICKIKSEEGIAEYFGIFGQFPLSKIHSSLPALIDSLQSDLKMHAFKWHRHEYMSFVIQNLLTIHRDSLDPTLIEQMYDYVIHVILHWYNKQDPSLAFVALTKFPLHKLQTSFMPLIESMMAELDTELCHWNRQENVCWAIYNVLCEYTDSLDQADIDRMFDYVIKVHLQWEGEYKAFHASYALSKFPVSKLQSSLPQLMDSIESDLKANQCSLRRQQNMNEIIENVLRDHRDSLNQSYINRIFDYLTNTILQCENKEQISVRNQDQNSVSTELKALRKIPKKMLEFPMIKLIESLERELEQTKQSCDWRRHDNMCMLMCTVLSKHQFALKSKLQTLLAQIFAYIGKLIFQCENFQLISSAFSTYAQFPLGKLFQSSFFELIDSLEGDLNSAQCHWHRHQNMGQLMLLVLNEHGDSFQDAEIDRLFDYLTKVINLCENAKLISRVIDAFSEFPISKLDNSMPSLIDSLESGLSAPSHRQWYRHQNMYQVILSLKMYRCDALSQTLHDRMSDYVVKLWPKICQ